VCSLKKFRKVIERTHNIRKKREKKGKRTNYLGEKTLSGAKRGGVVDSVRHSKAVGRPHPRKKKGGETRVVCRRRIVEGMSKRQM